MSIYSITLNETRHVMQPKKGKIIKGPISTAYKRESLETEEIPQASEGGQDEKSEERPKHGEKAKEDQEPEGWQGRCSFS